MSGDLAGYGAVSNRRKRTFSLPLFMRSFGSAILSLPVLAAALLIPSTSRALREKVMLAVTSVNDCRLCSYVHTGLALAHGVDVDELQHLLDDGAFGNVAGRDAIAVLFAQHFADTGRRPSPAARAALVQGFNTYQRIEILAYIHAIYFANLSANTVEAWLARLARQGARGGMP